MLKLWLLMSVLALAGVTGVLAPGAAFAVEVMPAEEMTADVSSVEDNGFFLSKQVDTDFAVTVENVKAALKGVSFGVLWETDLQKIMKEKLTIDIPPYLILGACNPGEAHKALLAEPWIGTLMPCNVVVMENAEGEVWVGIKHPQTIADETGNEEIQAIAEKLVVTLSGVLAGL